MAPRNLGNMGYNGDATGFIPKPVQQAASSGRHARSRSLVTGARAAKERQGMLFCRSCGEVSGVFAQVRRGV